MIMIYLNMMIGKKETTMTVTKMTEESDMMIEEIIEITMTRGIAEIMMIEEIAVIRKGNEVDQERMIEGGADLGQEKENETNIRKICC
jgi:hypothetical protein